MGIMGVLMTEENRLVESIITYLHSSYTDGKTGETWSERMAEENAKKIIEIVHSLDTKTYRWRASD